MAWLFYDAEIDSVPYAVLHLQVTGEIWEGADNPTDLPLAILRVSDLSKAVQKKLNWIRSELIRLYKVQDKMILLGLIMVPEGASVQEWHADSLANMLMRAIARFQAVMIPCSTGHRHTQFLNAELRNVASSSPEAIRDCHRSQPNWNAIEKNNGVTEFLLATPRDAIRWAVHIPHRGPANTTNELRTGVYAVFPVNEHGKELLSSETQGVLYDVPFGKQLDEICETRSNYYK
jgi:hypothetical protein